MERESALPEVSEYLADLEAIYAQVEEIQTETEKLKSEYPDFALALAGWRHLGVEDEWKKEYEGRQKIIDALKSIFEACQNAGNIFDKFCYHYADLLESLDITPIALQHNFQLHRQVNFLSDYDDMEAFEVDSIPNSKRQLKYHHLLLFFFSDTVKQTLLHLKTLKLRVEAAYGEITEPALELDLKTLTHTIIGSRGTHESIMTERLKHRLEKRGLADKVVFKEEDKLPMQVSVSVEAAPNSLKASEALVASVMYYLVSNATKKLHQKANADDKKLEVSWKLVQFEGQDFYAFEVFDNGEFIDTDSLYESLMDELAKSKTNFLDEKTRESVQKIIDLKSRQLDLTKIIPPSDVPFLRGHSGLGSSGIGLEETRNMIRNYGGAVMLNNVYGDDPGVACTALIPADCGDPKKLEKIRSIAETLKTLMQTGEFALPEKALAA